MRVGESPQRAQHLPQAAQEQPARVAQNDEVGVVGDKAAGGAQVEVRARRGRLIAEMVDVRHHVVPQAPLVVPHGVEVGVVEVGPQGGQGGLRDGDPEVPFRFRQREPEPPPETRAMPPAPQGLHGGGRIARSERRFVPAGRRHRM